MNFWFGYSTPATFAAALFRRSRPVLVTVFILVAGVSGLIVAKSALADSSLQTKQHRVVILIDSDDAKVMGHAISYAINLERSFAAKSETVQIEVVANASGIKLLRADTSPLQEPLAAVRQVVPGIVFSMCDSSRRLAEQKEGHAISLIPGARLVPFGIGRVVELEEAGWSYVHG